MNSRTPTEQRFLELVNEHQLRLWRLGRGFAAGQEEPEALYQEILFQIWRALADQKEAQATPTWVYQVALNTASSLVRKRGFRPAGLAQSAAPGPGSGDPEARLTAALSQLQPLESALATLYLENLSAAEMASVLGLSSGQVGTLLRRLRNQLAALLQEPHLNETEWQQRWRHPSVLPPTSLSEAQQLQRVKARSEQFGRSVRQRDRVEIVAALFLMICFGVYFFLFRFPLARLGCVVVILSAGSIGWKLLRSRESRTEAAASAPLVECLQQELARIQAQAQRLQTMLYWHIVPLLLGLNLFCFGLPRQGGYKIYFLVMTVGLSLGVYWVNRRGLRKRMQPLKAELELFL